jgi:hypothetical protein
MEIFLYQLIANKYEFNYNKGIPTKQSDKQDYEWTD